MLRLEHLAELAERHRPALSARVNAFDIAGRRFDGNTRPALMGVVNLSPDSWYRESVVLSTEAAIQRASILAAQGADLIDLGAESTLHHAARVDPSGQNNRLVPVVRALCERQLRVSVETYAPEVTRACLQAGAHVLNLTGTDPTQEVFRIVADHDAALILCYVQGDHVRAVADFDLTADPIALMYDYFARQIERATAAGVRRLFIDPGLGFYYRNLQDSAVRVRHQMTVFLSTFRLRELGWPTCHALPHAFEFFGEEVRCAEPFFTVLAALGRTDLFRTHEVPRTKAVLDTLQSF